MYVADSGSLTSGNEVEIPTTWVYIIIAPAFCLGRISNLKPARARALIGVRAGGRSHCSRKDDWYWGLRRENALRGRPGSADGEERARRYQRKPRDRRGQLLAGYSGDWSQSPDTGEGSLPHEHTHKLRQLFVSKVSLIVKCLFGHETVLEAYVHYMYSTFSPWEIGNLFSIRY